ncbi:hypothetical protein LCGC14_0853170 [marine sediment metagenome]|uniref:Uncharacterized protein n=1 Tax=marine sediment metagenome TaxID=412755 RepID=A0A0F9P9P3_9ZZZZ
MEAKDTLIGPLTLDITGGSIVNEALTESIWAHIRLQAERSLKAGRAEVVDWIQEHETLLHEEVLAFSYTEWESKLKEWAMGNEDSLVCPFCGDDGFDLIGLKDHLIVYCEIYDEVPQLNHL